MRILRVESEVLPGVLPDTKVREIRALIDELDIDPGVLVTFKGQDEEQQASADFLSKAFVVALFIMAIILVTQFNSFYRAFLILSAIILSTVGVMIGLLVMNQPFSIVMTGVGIITLGGRRREQQHRPDRHLRASCASPEWRRSRRSCAPARNVCGRSCLTAITTVIGLMPMVTGVGIDFVTREVSCRRAIDAVVGATRHRRRLRPDVRDNPHAFRHALHVGAGPTLVRPRQRIARSPESPAG